MKTDSPVNFMHRLIMIGTFLSLSISAFAQSPNAIVEEVVAILGQEIGSRKAEFESDDAALYEMIDGILAPRFDRKYAAQLVLARNWRTASATQRSDFTQVFYDSLLKRYGNGVLEFNQDKIEVLAYRGDDTKKRTTVKTIVKIDGGKKVPVNYVLVKRESDWLIFDVVIEGISYIRNFRVEMAAEIKNTSLDAVIKRLRKEVAKNSAVADSGATEATVDE